MSSGARELLRAKIDEEGEESGAAAMGVRG